MLSMWGTVPCMPASLPKLYSAFSKQLCQRTYNPYSTDQHPVKIDGACEGLPDSAGGVISVNSPKIHEVQELQTS